MTAALVEKLAAGLAKDCREDRPFAKLNDHWRGRYRSAARVRLDVIRRAGLTVIDARDDQVLDRVAATLSWASWRRGSTLPPTTIAEHWNAQTIRTRNQCRHDARVVLAELRADQ